MVDSLVAGRQIKGCAGTHAQDFRSYTLITRLSIVLLVERLCTTPVDTIIASAGRVSLGVVDVDYSAPIGPTNDLPRHLTVKQKSVRISCISVQFY